MRRREFRDDLYFRLNILRLSLPPLAERGTDVLLLAREFIAANCARTGQRAKTLSPGVEQALLRYPWPGNIRELQNVCERICVLCRDDEVTEDFLRRTPIFDDTSRLEETESGLDIKEAVQRRERELILDALLKSANSKSDAASLLGVSRTTLWKKMRELGIE